MNKRTFFALFLSAVVLLGTSTFAQRPAGKGGFGHGGHEFAGLNLTVEQKAQIRTIHQDQRTKMETLSKESHTRAEFRTQAMSIHKDARDKIVNGVLTGEQRAQLQQKRQERQQRFSKQPPAGN
jgi:Spy/CpxP family protein refolding chaperone